jgi:hypothetical protein
MTISLLATLGCFLAAAAPASGSAWSRTFSAADGPPDKLSVVVPFYEGVRLDGASAALLDSGHASLTLAYPGVLSAPFVAWQVAPGAWEVAYVDALGPAPAELELHALPGVVKMALRSLAGRAVRTERVAGDLAALGAVLRARWKPVGSGDTLARHFHRQNFYVHQFVASQGAPALRRDWELPALVEHMKQESPDTIQFVYGYDPSGVDLAGEYFWSEGALAGVRQIIGANRRLAHSQWLNLRTWKRAIPRLGIERPVTGEVKAMLKVFPATTGAADQFSFKSLDACLASAGWQRSRLAQFERIADLGFRVVQIDEFPIPALWHSVACQSATHLHRRGDIVDEWRQIDLFLARLAARARARGVLLTCEEPSALMLPYVAGYIDRQFNDSIELYGSWRRSKHAAPIPLFSTVFGALATPYTDTDDAAPARRPPPGWIPQHKISPPRR